MKYDEIRYQDALPEMPDSFTRRMKAEIERMDEVMKRRHKLATTLVAALITAVLIAGAAIAAVNSQLLDYLFPIGAPEAAQQLLVHDNLSDERGGIKLTVTEHLYDGRSFHINWNVESARDDAVFVSTEYEMNDIQGNPIEITRWSNRLTSTGSCEDELRALNLPVGDKVTARAYEASTSNSYLTTEAPTGPWTYTLNIYAYKTTLTPIALDGYAYELADEQIAAMARAGQIGIDMINEMACIYRYPEYQAVLSTNDWPRSNRAKNRVAANEACGLLEPIAHLSVTLHMDPTKASELVQRRVMKQPTELTFKDFTLKLSELGFDLTGAYATYSVPESVMSDDHPQLSNLFLILDQDDRILNGVMSEGSCGWMPLDDGGPGMEVEQGGGVPEAVPTELRLLRGPKEAQELIERYEFDGAMKMYKADPTEWEEQAVELE